MLNHVKVIATDANLLLDMMRITVGIYGTKQIAQESQTSREALGQMGKHSLT